jgi:hypothetical protein
MDDKKVTDIKDITSGGLVELPSFYDGKPFVAKLKRPSLISLCARGIIPNELLKEAQDIWEGKNMQEGHIESYGKVLLAVAEASLVEPTYEEVKDYLTDVQLVAIYNYAQMGVLSHVPFSKIEELLKSGNTIKKDGQTSKQNNRNKK